MNMRKTKIICTLGPAVDHAETIERLIRTGMNAARFNFSHGSHAEQLARLNMFKKVRDTLGAPVATILDTKGPEIRIKTFADGPVTLEQGQGFILTTDDVPGDGRRVSVTYANLHKEVGPGCRILVDDGLIELRVQKVEGHEIHCEVENGGPLSSNMSSFVCFSICENYCTLSYSISGLYEGHGLEDAAYLVVEAIIDDCATILEDV